MPPILRLPRAAGRALAKGGLFHFIFFVTARCNARCRMCFYLEEIEHANENIADELTIGEIQTLFKKLGYVPYVSFSGGEPFLRDDIFEILDYAATYSKPLVLSTPTNCFSPEKIHAVFSRLCPKHPEIQIEAQISIDGVGEVHDAIRRVPGLFEKAVETLERLRHLQAGQPNLKIKLVTTFSAFNQDSVSDLIDYAGTSLPFDRMILAWAHGNCDEAAKTGLDYTRYKGFLRRIEKINSQRSRSGGAAGLTPLGRLVKNCKENTRLRWDREKSLGRYCNAGRKIAVLSERGELYACEPLSFSLGNVRNAGYSVQSVLDTGYENFATENPPKECHCDWGCGQNVAVVTNPKFWLNVF